MIKYQSNLESVMSIKENYKFKDGVKDGIPIGLGYLAVSIALGVTASTKGIPSLIALLMSITNLTSAGQYAGIGIIADINGTFLSIIITQLIINCRYSVMSISLSQKLDKTFTTFWRFICAFGITDEIFGVAINKEKPIGRKYTLGLILLPFFGWGLGTFLGAVAGNILPIILVDALSIALFAMFIAIILPPSTKNLGICLTVISSAILSSVFYFFIVDLLPDTIKSLSYIICAIIVAVIFAIVKPIKEIDDEK